MTHLPCFLEVGLLSFFPKPAHPEGSPLHPNLRNAPAKHLISEHNINPHLQSCYAFKSIPRHFSFFLLLYLSFCHLLLRIYLFNIRACESTAIFYTFSIYYKVHIAINAVNWCTVQCHVIFQLAIHLYRPGSWSRTHSVCSQQRLCWTVAVYQLFIGLINLHSVAASLAVRHVYQYTLCFAGRKEIAIGNKSLCEGFCQRTVIDLWSLSSGTKQWRMPDVIRRSIWLFSVIVLKNKRVDRG